MRNNILTSLFALAIALVITSCDDYGKPDPYIPYAGENAYDYSAKVYINNLTTPVNEYRFNAIYTEKDDKVTLKGDTMYKFPVKITTPVNEKLTVKCVINEDFVKKYNEINKTAYIALPSTYYTFIKDEVIIEQGQVKSQDSITIQLKTSADIKKITDELLLPIQVTSVNGKTERISSNLATVKVFGAVNVIRDNVNPDNPEQQGNLIKRDTWKVTAVGQYGNNSYDRMLDGNPATAWFSPLSATTQVEVDMTKEFTLKGFRLTPNRLFGLGYNPTKMEVLTSNNGKKWTIQGIYTGKIPTSGDIHISFKTSVKTQYFRLRILESNKYPYTGIAELNAVGE